MKTQFQLGSCCLKNTKNATVPQTCKLDKIDFLTLEHLKHSLYYFSIESLGQTLHNVTTGTRQKHFLTLVKCPAVGVVTILLKPGMKNLKFWRIDECSHMLFASKDLSELQNMVKSPIIMILCKPNGLSMSHEQTPRSELRAMGKRASKRKALTSLFTF